jgi:hypothetical protein
VLKLIGTVLVGKEREQEQHISVGYKEIDGEVVPNIFEFVELNSSTNNNKNLFLMVSRMFLENTNNKYWEILCIHHLFGNELAVTI